MEGTPITDDEIEALFDRTVAEIEAERLAGGSGQPTIRSEDEFVAHMVAESAKLGVTGIGIEDAMRGLARVCRLPGGYHQPRATNPLSRFEQLRMLNNNELNQACRKHLPPDRRDPSELCCLGLALWGLTEADLRYSSGWPNEDDMLNMVLKLFEWPPEEAYDWLICEPGTGGESVRITAADLSDVDKTDAAIAILDALQSSMIVNRL